MDVLFCDNHILVVSKPAGLSTQPHLGSPHNLQDEVKAYLKEAFKKPGNVFLEPIHRLDKPVSGLVLFARTSKALSRLQEEMREQRIKKTYLAWVEGILPDSKGTLEHTLVHDEHKARVVNASHPQGKLARLHYAQIQKKGDQTLVEVALETGRYHQIRTQFAAAGCPVVGDVKYGSTIALQKDRIALHHFRLEFVHPVTKEVVQFESHSFSSCGSAGCSASDRRLRSR